MKRSWLVLILGINCLACSKNEITQIASPIFNIGGASNIPSDLSDPSNSSAGFDSIRVGIFGHNQDCSNVPNNSSGIVRKGCVAGITATPKLNGVDVSEAVHGPTCDWYFNGTKISTGSGSSAAVIVQVDSNPFNIYAQGVAAGSFTLQAEVKGKKSDVITFRVE